MPPEAIIHTPTERAILRVPAFPWRVNQAGFIRAGHVLKLIDINASEAALNYVHHQTSLGGKAGVVVTASVDRTNFVAPIHAWDMISMTAILTQVWTTSLECQVRIRAENFITQSHRDVAVAHLVFVAIDLETRQKIDLLPYQPTDAIASQLAQEADTRKNNRAIEGNALPFIAIESGDNPVVSTKEMTPMDANAQCNVFGGIILEIMGEVAADAAQRQALGETVVGVRLDRMSFLAPTYIGEVVEAMAIVTKTWRTSMEVQVEVHAVNPHTQDRRIVAMAYMVHVRTAPNGRPLEVPPWIPKTDNQKLRAEAAQQRRQTRQDEESVSVNP